jgi:hypothetical protein
MNSQIYLTIYKYIFTHFPTMLLDNIISRYLREYWKAMKMCGFRSWLMNGLSLPYFLGLKIFEMTKSMYTKNIRA